MVALGLSSGAASRLLVESVSLVEQLPASLAALEAGTISWAHAQMLVEVLGPMGDDAKRAEVESRLLARAAGNTLPQLRVAARRVVLRADADAAASRLAAAIRDRQVRVFTGRGGMASLSATLPTPVALACRQALRRYAEACATPDDERTLEQRMVDCLADLLLRTGETGLPPVQVQLTVVADVNTLRGGDEPGEIDGDPVPAGPVRELVYALGLLRRPMPASDAPNPREASEATTSNAGVPEATAPEATATKATAPAVMAAGTAPASECAVEPAAAPDTDGLRADEAAAARIAGLLGFTAVAGTTLAHPPTIAVTDEISGQLLALTSAAATCSRRVCRTGTCPCTHPPDGPGLGPPPTTPGYWPAESMQRFVAARDRRCRFPGCRAPAVRCDLDHNTPWPAGATRAGNLCCLCHHHRLSHQAPGWTMRRLPDGGLHWTTPGGDRTTTHPPRYGTDDPGPPGDRAAQGTASKPLLDPPLTARERVLGRPRPPGYVDDDPAPF